MSGGAFVLYEFALLFSTSGGIFAVIGLVVYFSNAIPKARVRRYLPSHSQKVSVRDFSADYLLSMILAAGLVALTGLAVIWVLNSQGKHDLPPGYYPHVGSLRTGLKELKVHAMFYSPDAYLVEATMHLSSTAKIRIDAVYESTKNRMRQIDVSLMNDGTISTTMYATTSSSAPGENRAIRDEDWRLDSEDALRIFATKDGVSSCLAFPQHDNRLKLSKIIIAGTPRVVWMLSLRDCHDFEYIGLLIDADTGEWLPNLE
jgi:hypothetical protein